MSSANTTANLCHLTPLNHAYSSCYVGPWQTPSIYGYLVAHRMKHHHQIIGFQAIRVGQISSVVDQVMQ